MLLICFAIVKLLLYFLDQTPNNILLTCPLQLSIFWLRLYQRIKSIFYHMLSSTILQYFTCDRPFPTLLNKILKKNQILSLSPNTLKLATIHVVEPMLTAVFRTFVIFPCGLKKYVLRNLIPLTPLTFSTFLNIYMICSSRIYSSLLLHLTRNKQRWIFWDSYFSNNTFLSKKRKESIFQS